MELKWDHLSCTKNVTLPVVWYLWIKRLVGWLCLASHRQRGHLLSLAKYVKLGLSKPGLSHGSPLHNCCATPAPLHEDETINIYVKILKVTNSPKKEEQIKTGDLLSGDEIKTFHELRLVVVFPEGLASQKGLHYEFRNVNMSTIK